MGTKEKLVVTGFVSITALVVATLLPGEICLNELPLAQEASHPRGRSLLNSSAASKLLHNRGLDALYEKSAVKSPSPFQELGVAGYTQVYLPFYSDMAADRRKRVRDGTLGDSTRPSGPGSMWSNIDDAAKGRR